MEAACSVMYPILADSSLAMSIQALERTTLSQRRLGRPSVRAAGVLRRDASTEIIDVNKLSQKNTSIIQYVEVAEAGGKLYCVDGLVSTHYWLKIVTLAKDCHSCNVLLMTTDKGVILKTIRSIAPGEPLLMWFTENILAMLNMPFLTPSNIQGQNRYICHVCNNLFENPNPLKIHLALKCNRLDSNHLWTVLAKEFLSPLKTGISLSFFPSRPPFKFELNHSLNRISPVLVETMDSSASVTNNSPASSNQESPSSSNNPSPKSSSTHVSPKSPTPLSPIRKTLSQRHSAFKPYMNQAHPFQCSTVAMREDIALRETALYHVQPPPPPPPPPAPTRTDVHAAQMESIVSNLGKSKGGHLCLYCGKVYSRKYGLKIHIRTHTGYKPLKCKFCLRPFGDPSNLNKHVRLHADGDTPYRCELCGKVLVRRRDLERHIKSRHQNHMEHMSDTSSDGIDA
ncbi:transcription factor hamlet-like [Prorops nasuta]|uniref:transcription factor hamlet-like n=1 Tax=Prorops nasuta TaxID=863751 RepID=UPI0034CEA572